MASAAFRSQFEHFGQNQPQHAAAQRQHFDTKSLDNVLPPSVLMANLSQWYPQYSSTGAMQQPPNMYQTLQPLYLDRSSNQMPPASQHMMYPQHVMPQMQGQYPALRGQNQGQPYPMNAHWPGYNQNSPQSPEMRFARATPGQAMGTEFQHFERRPSLPPVPSFPRGPPRKPKQSGHALWVGNLPPGATVRDLKDHFSRDATKDIESLFLISKSNCAFVNYRSEESCISAMTRFHNSRFHGAQLVCRLRRGAGAGTSSDATPTTPSENDTGERTSLANSKTGADSPEPENEKGPTIVGGSGTPSSSNDLGNPLVVDSNTRPPIKAAAALSVDKTPTKRVSERFFIIKSLTAQDLESSLTNGIWATQSHNETSLNQAFRYADNVYLVFSANKSGEYFGYARMTSPIEGQPVNLNANVAPVSTKETISPYAISTQATATAPRGRIIDDSARGTIFWEAERSDDEQSGSAQQKGGESSGSTWGRQFSIEWISTTRLPFYKARGLRNPWNSNREVKIARDGTEIEPSIGRRLVQMFHQAPNAASRGSR